MKHGHKNTRPQERQDFQALQERVTNWELPTGPSDDVVWAKAVAETRQFYNEALGLRKHGPHDTELSELHGLATQLWHAALDAAYPASFWKDFDRLRARDAAGLESAVAYLEADPMFFRSGYVKARLIRHIKPAMLGPSEAARLRGVVLHVVDTRDDRDFRAFCRLARSVDAPELRAALTQRLMHDDANVGRRARWVLDALGPPR